MRSFCFLITHSKINQELLLNERIPSDRYLSSPTMCIKIFHFNQCWVTLPEWLTWINWLITIFQVCRTSFFTIIKLQEAKHCLEMYSRTKKWFGVHTHKYPKHSQPFRFYSRWPSCDLSWSVLASQTDSVHVCLWRPHAEQDVKVQLYRCTENICPVRQVYHCRPCDWNISVLFFAFASFFSPPSQETNSGPN